MVWTTFESINNRCNWIHESMAEIKKDMLIYLRDAVKEVGVILVHYNGHLVHVALRIMKKGDTEQNPILIDKNGQEFWCDELHFETLYDICKQIREMRLFREYGDPEENEQPEQEEEQQ